MAYLEQRDHRPGTVRPDIGRLWQLLREIECEGDVRGSHGWVHRCCSVVLAQRQARRFCLQSYERTWSLLNACRGSLGGVSGLLQVYFECVPGHLGTISKECRRSSGGYFEAAPKLLRIYAGSPWGSFKLPRDSFELSRGSFRHWRCPETPSKLSRDILKVPRDSFETVSGHLKAARTAVAYIRISRCFVITLAW